MRKVLLSESEPIYLDSGALDLLRQARSTARVLGLNETCLVQAGRDVALFTWTGTRINTTIGLLGHAEGLAVSDLGIGVCFHETSRDDVLEFLSNGEVDLIRQRILSAMSCPPEIEKFDALLESGDLTRAYLRNHLDVSGAAELVGNLHRVLSRCG